jgi:two-component sensor histidine kinase
MSFSKDKRQETFIYLALWAILFMAPVMNSYIRAGTGNAEFDWSEVFMMWKQYAIFFVIFLIHNHLLAPLLVYRQKRLLYFSLVGAFVVAFAVYQCTSRPHMMGGPGGKPPHEMARHHGPPPMDEHQPPDMTELPPPKIDEREHFKGDRPPMGLLGQHDVLPIVILILMLGMNIGIKLYFKQRHDQRRMISLEKENLKQQLEYLKYQINPHFFMNTLNNIHALVDIDPEKAKDTILELSKLMRYVLYEGAKDTVLLQREIDFLRNYIRLMQIRYTDKVKISFEEPDVLPEKSVPPLLFITFVENAFKHGVSYKKSSFINVKLLIEGERIKFVCRNSKIDEKDDQHGGVGLQNVKQRLELIYDKNFTLDITDENDIYDVRLSIPML